MARSNATSASGAMSRERSTFVSLEKSFLSGTRSITCQETSPLFSRSILRLSVTTAPPSIEARASSRAPVMVTPTSRAAATPIFAACTPSISSSRASSVARTAAFAAVLLLFRPLATGISLLVRTVAP
ncbi:Uncharacterised protein [uncultured archaeon]|nr:Uncharacterised protein [uncultured archaeon]